MQKKIQRLVVSVILTGGLLLPALFGVRLPPAAQAATTWWPDGNDVANDARATWVYFSTSEFSSNWSTSALVDASVLEMRDKKIDILIVSLTGTDMHNLSNASSPRTVLIQRIVSQAATYGMVVYIAYWEDEFSGSAFQTGLYTDVDYVIAFNNNNGSQADIVGVVSDYEMHENSTYHNRNTARFDQWRQFHANLKNRIGSGNLKLIPTSNDPDVLITNCTDCTDAWKAANGITGSSYPFNGDVNYFTAYGGVRFADAYIGLYYYKFPNTILTRSDDDIAEANGLTPAVPIIVAYSVGPNFDPTLTSEKDVNQVVDGIEAKRVTYPNGALGTMGWRWDDPTDGDAEYRGVISSQPPSGPTATPSSTPTKTNTPSASSTPTMGPSPTSTSTSTKTATPTSGPSSTPTRTPTASGSVVMHVADMLTTDINGNPQTVFAVGDKIYWRVKVVDQNGAVVAGASVTTELIKPNGALWTTLTSATDTGGWALFNKSTLSNSQTGTYTINVTNVTLAGAIYNPAANVKSSITCTLQ